MRNKIENLLSIFKIDVASTCVAGAYKSLEQTDNNLRYNFFCLAYRIILEKIIDKHFDKTDMKAAPWYVDYKGEDAYTYCKIRYSIFKNKTDNELENISFDFLERLDDVVELYNTLCRRTHGDIIDNEVDVEELEEEFYEFLKNYIYIYIENTIEEEFHELLISHIANYPIPDMDEISNGYYQLDYINDISIKNIDISDHDNACIVLSAECCFEVGRGPSREDYTSCEYYPVVASCFLNYDQGLFGLKLNDVNADIRSFYN